MKYGNSKETTVSPKGETQLTNTTMQKNMKEKVPEQEQPKTEVKSETLQERKPHEPQMITINGDKISHAHAFKSDKSDAWFYTAKINGVPLKPQVMTLEDVEKVLSKNVPVQEMMQKYYPSKLMPRVNPAEFKLPQTIQTGEGEQQIVKFNVYKETDQKMADYGKYRFYAQVGMQKMSVTGSKQDLDAYFDGVTTPKQLVVKNFGDRLGMKEHYEQFQLPEGTNLVAKDILIKKNQVTNRYELSVEMEGKGEIPAKELSYADRQSYFNKVATKEQLAAKYLGNEIKALSNAPALQQTKQMNVSMK